LESTAGRFGHLTFTNNTILALQLSQLGSINGSLVIEDNKLLFDVGFPRLQTVYSNLTVHNNSQLLNFTANVLEKASSISMSGPFTNVEFFFLQEVSGDFEIIGEPSMDCSWFDDHFRNKIVKGRYNCVGDHSYKPRSPSTSTELPSDTPKDPADLRGPGSEENSGGLTKPLGPALESAPPSVDSR